MTDKFLSKAVCEVMIKVVLRSIPMYVMSAYLLPLTTYLSGDREEVQCLLVGC